MCLYVEERGSGPVVLLVGGTPTSAEYLAPLVERLAASHRVLRPDLPGYGKRPPLHAPYALDEAGQLLEDVLLDRGIEEAAFVGFSFGAWRALRLALGSRVRPTAVISLAGVAWLSQEEQDGFGALAGALRSGVDLRDALPARFLSPAWAALHPEHVAGVREWLTATTTDTLAAELDAVRGLPDLRPGLGRLSCPVLARVGSVDAPALVDHARSIAAAAPRGELQVVPGAGHALLYEDRDGTADAVARAIEPLHQLN